MAFSFISSNKGKSALMILAGAIGVFLVGTILAFSTGLNSYINTVQTTTLSQYPITFDQTRDMSKLKSYVDEENQQKELANSEFAKRQAKKEETIEKAKSKKRAALNSVIGNFLNFATSGTNKESNKPTKNDLKSFNPLIL